MVQGCFSNPGSPNSSNTNSSNISKENLITCIYQTRLLDSPTYLTLTWSKTPFSHTLTLHAPHFFSITISLCPPTFSLFRTRVGSKSIPLTHQPHSRDKIKLYWDFTRAEFTHPNSAEPESRFYLGLVYNNRVEFFLGDLRTELTRRVGGSRVRNSGESTLLSRREHVFGRKHYSTRAEFLGSTHLIEIECSGGSLRVKINGENKLTIKRLAWKFRGNERIFIDGVGIEFFWDVFNWLEKNSGGNNGVFVFQIGGPGVWPEMVGPEKKLMRKSSPPVGSMVSPVGSGSRSGSGSCSSVLQWAEESSDCGRSSSGCSSTGRTSGCSGGGCGGDGVGAGFSLVLYAWRRC